MLGEMLQEDPGGPPVAFAERMGEFQAGVYLGESVDQLVQFKVVPCSCVDAAMHLTLVHVHAVVITEVVDIPAGTAFGDVDGPVLPGLLVDVAEQVRVDRLEVVSVEVVVNGVGAGADFSCSKLGHAVLDLAEFVSVRDLELVVEDGARRPEVSVPFIVPGGAHAEAAQRVRYFCIARASFSSGEMRPSSTSMRSDTSSRAWTLPARRLSARVCEMLYRDWSLGSWANRSGHCSP